MALTQVKPIKKAKQLKKKAKIKTKADIKSFDYTFIFVLMFITGFGLVMGYSASGFSKSTFMGQCVFAAAGIVLMLILGFFDSITGFFLHKKFDYNLLNRKKIAIIIFLISIASVFAILLWGKHLNGASRWIVVGPVTIQPAEIVKISVIILTAYLICANLRKPVKDIEFFFRGNKKSKNSPFFWKKLFPIWLLCGVFPAGLLYLITNNLSSALVVFFTMFFMTLIAYKSADKSWFRGYFPFIATGVLIAVIVFFAIIISLHASDTESFRMARIPAWINPEQYTEEEGYQILQSKYAIGSGGFLGKGLGRSMQKMADGASRPPLPEAQNDMIFSIICEELGVFGAILVVGLYLLLLWRLYTIAKNAPNLFGRTFVTGVFLHVAIQFLLNIAVATNSIVNTGVTLPFISYGGSAIICLFIEMGIVLNISRQSGNNQTGKTYE